MTKEEYKKQLVRIFDSVRTEHKGEESCAGIRCENCPFNKNVCKLENVIFNSFEAVEFVENWAKDHPIKTNAEKFREVFGFDMTICWDNEFPCNECQFCDIDGTCNSKEKFWDAEYKPTKEY